MGNTGVRYDHSVSIESTVFNTFCWHGNEGELAEAKNKLITVLGIIKMYSLRI